jgi:hypothetical protein
MSKYIYLTSKIDRAGSYVPARVNTISPDGTQITLLNGIPTGYTENQRIGRKIDLKRLKLIVDVDVSTSVGSDVRFVVVYYRHPNGKPVSESTFFYDHPDCTLRSALLPFNEHNIEDIVVLSDKIISAQEVKRTYQLDIDLTGKSTIYSGDTEFQDHVNDGGLYTICLGSAYLSSPSTSTATVGYMQFTGTLFYNDK